MKTQQTRVGDILELRREPLTIEPDSEYRRIGIYSWGKGFLHRPSTPGSEMGGLRYFTFPERALVLSNIQAWEAAVAVSGPAERHHVASNRFLPYVPTDETRVSVDYLLHYFLSEDGLAALRRASPGTQVRNRTLGQALFEDIEVPLPEMSDQRLIASHLQGLRARVGRIFTTRVDALAVVDSALRQLTWDTPLHTILREDLDEVELEPSKQYRQLGVFGMGRGIIDRGTFTGADTKYTKMLRVRSGQAVLSRLKAFEGAVAVADPQHGGALVSKEFPTFTVTDEVDPQFVRAVLTGSALVERLRAKSIGVGARRERVDAQRFLSIKVPLPAPQIQQSIGRAADRAIRIRALQQRNIMLGNALLPAARNEVFSSLR